MRFKTINTSPFPTYTTPGKLYPGLTWHSCFIPMRDGVRLAADIYLPKGLSETGLFTVDERLPAILIQTRYWRAMEPRPPVSWFLDDLSDIYPFFRDFKRFFVKHGYAIVYVDVRGTGASFGAWNYPWEPISRQDAYDILDWIIAQPWSNGCVAGTGISYLGTTAELLLTINHPAVKAVIPQFNHPDSYQDIAFPGGVFNARFIRDWSEVDASQDRNEIPTMMGRVARWVTRGVRPVNNDRAALKEAIDIHRANGNSFLLGKGIAFRDDTQPEAGIAIDDLAIASYWERICESRIPTYGWASWLDGGTAAAALQRFLTYPGADHVTIGAWNHGGFKQASPYQSPDAAVTPPFEKQWMEILRFLDAHLKNIDNGVKQERLVNYYTLGAETWQSSPIWPPPAVKNERLFLATGNRLEMAYPQTAGDGDPDGEDKYLVDWQATTGNLNRWWELSIAINSTVVYANRGEQSAHLLCYFTDPLEQDLEIAGSPILHLTVASSAPDCVFYAYLEDIAPDGKVYYLTEGQLRSIHRKVSQPPAPITSLVPYHSYRQSDVSPLPPDEPSDIVFGLQPVSALVRQSHRLRLGLAGYDAGTFLRIPELGDVQWTIYRNASKASWIDVPVVRK